MHPKSLKTYVVLCGELKFVRWNWQSERSEIINMIEKDSARLWSVNVGLVILVQFDESYWLVGLSSSLMRAAAWRCPHCNLFKCYCYVKIGKYKSYFSSYTMCLFERNDTATSQNTDHLLLLMEWVELSKLETLHC